MLKQTLNKWNAVVLLSQQIVDDTLVLHRSGPKPTVFYQV